MAGPVVLKIQTTLSQNELESELRAALPILKKDPEYASPLAAAGTPAASLPSELPVEVQPTGNNLIPPGVAEYLIEVAAGLTVEGIVLLIDIIRHRKGSDSVKVKQ